MNETVNGLLERKSVRAFTGESISEENVRLILEAAVNAPTAGNQQMYTILNITDGKLKEQLSVSCDRQPFIAKAELVLIFCADCKKWHDGFLDCGCSPRKPGAGDLLLAVSDACIAAQNAVTAAWALGIGSCYIGDILENCEYHRALLHLPAYVFPAAMVVFGYPTEQQKGREKPVRAPLNRIVSENAYPDMTSEYREDLFQEKGKRQLYEAGMKAFCERKYNSDFAREMTRSVEVYLKDYLE